MRRAESVDMTQGPLFKKMLVFSLPLMMTGVLQLLYNAADLVVVGQFSGKTAMGAVGACSSLISVIVNLAIGLSLGVGVSVAHDLGSRSYDKLKKTVHSALLLGAVCGTAVFLVGFFFAKPLLVLMGTPENILEEAVPYMKAYFVGLPAQMVYNYAASVLRSNGDTKHPLLFLFISGLSNVALNLVMVTVFEMGAIGVGIATAASQYIALGLIISYMSKLDSPCRVSFKDLKWSGSEVKRIIAIGAPSGLQSTLFSMSNVIIQSTVNLYGEVVIAGNSAAASIEGFTYVVMNSVAQATVVFVGQNAGAHKYGRFSMILKDSLLLSVVIGLIFSMSTFALSDILLGFYAPGQADVIEAGMRRMSVILPAYFLCGMMDVTAGMLRGMGKTVISMIISLVGSCAFRIVWIFTVCEVYKGSPDALNNIYYLYASYPVSWLLTFLVMLIGYTVVKNRILSNKTVIKI